LTIKLTQAVTPIPTKRDSRPRQRRDDSSSSPCPEAFE
jgi:hypothetical protein